LKAVLHDKSEYANHYRVFKDRFEAGKVLAEMMSSRYVQKPDTTILAIPAGGVPVGIEISKRLKLPFELMIVQKIQIPGNAEAGFGAMTPEGSVFLSVLYLLKGRTLVSDD